MNQLIKPKLPSSVISIIWATIAMTIIGIIPLIIFEGHVLIIFVIILTLLAFLIGFQRLKKWALYLFGINIFLLGIISFYLFKVYIEMVLAGYFVTIVGTLACFSIIVTDILWVLSLVKIVSIRSNFS